MQTCGKNPCFARPGTANGKPVRYCVPCEMEFPGYELVSNPDEFVEKPDPNAYDGPEKKLVSAIVRALESRGATVFQCGQLIAKGSGSTVGLPDLICSVRGSERPMRFVGVEVKNKGGAIRTAQLELAKRGAIVIVRSVDRALEVTGY